MTDFVPGQRWICASELHMGLGTVLAVEPRTVTIVFLASGETRIYAKQSAPLHRVVFASGDRVRSHDGRTLTIASVSEHAGLVTYSGRDEHGNPAELQEGQLDNFLQLNRPGDRLFSGQIDPDKWFELRYQTLQKRNLLAHSDLYGLIGCRTSLIPHQLYIAAEVAGRAAPRVLLADEVGLGKTIEAGMILHQQLLTGRASRGRSRIFATRRYMLSKAFTWSPFELAVSRSDFSRGREGHGLSAAFAAGGEEPHTAIADIPDRLLGARDTERLHDAVR